MKLQPKWKSLAQPRIDSKWTEINSIHPAGSKLTSAKVMAYADGYVMARFPGCIPFVCSLEKWYERFTRQVPA